MANKDIRRKLVQHNIRFWELADAVGVSASTLTVWMRHDLSEERLARVQAALDKLIGAEVNAGSR